MVVAMDVLGAALHETATFPTHPESLATFQAHLDDRWIDEALEAYGVGTLRKRRLPAEQVVWLVLGMALMRDRPMAEVVKSLDLALPGRDGTAIVAPSSVTQARQRLGPNPIEHLFEKTGREWGLERAERQAWNGLSVFGIDGTTLRVSDSEENETHFGKTKGARGESAYPLVRVVALMALRSHLLVSAHFGPYGVSELEYAKMLWDDIPRNSLTIMDRAYLTASVLLGLQSEEENRHWLTRAKSTTKWEVLDSFGRYDKLVRMRVSSEARRKDPHLPPSFVARAVRYKHPDSKKEQWLLTSLLDAKAYPAAELVALYHERWEIELGYDEIKTHMLQSELTLRSRTVATVEQELWGVLLAYNLIRLEMDGIAEEADVAPNRISFMMAMRFIRDEWHWCAVASPGSIPKKLKRMRENVAQFVLPPRRSLRRYPRAVKIKMSNYKKKRSIKGKAEAAK